MGNKIITEKDFWICTSGAAPAQLQGIRKSNKQKSEEVYITIADTSTSSWIDFGCTKNMVMNALITAIAVVVVVALVVGTGGVAAIGLMGMMAIGLGAGVTAGVITAVEGVLTCGQKNAGQREWKNYKKDLIFTGSYAVTGGSFMECKVGGVVKYSPKVKTWTDALLFAGTSYSLKLVECAAVGAGAGAGGFYMAPVVAGLWGGTTAFAAPSLPSIGGNLWAMVYGAKGEMAVMRGAGGADSLLHDWATKENETAGGALDAFATGASSEYALGKKIHQQGYVTPSDVGQIALYIAFLGANFKPKVPAPTKPKFNPEQNAEFIDAPENLGNPKDPEPPSTPKDGEAFEDPIDPRFKKLSEDPQTGTPNDKGVEEAQSILQAEKEGFVNNPTRPNLSKGEPNLDFKVDGPPPYKYADVKTPIEPGSKPNSSLENQASGMGKKIIKQKGGSKDVLHIVDLKKVPIESKAIFKETVIKNAGGSDDGIIFINDK